MRTAVFVLVVGVIFLGCWTLLGSPVKALGWTAVFSGFVFFAAWNPRSHRKPGK